MQSNAAAPIVNERKPSSAAAFARAASRIGQADELSRWERAIFFEPRLQEAERRAQPAAHRLALLLALLLGPLALGTAVASDAANSGSTTSSSQTVTDWLISLILPSEEETTTHSMKSSETEDPSEGDPA